MSKRHMRAKIGLITAFLLFCALVPGLAYYDDFQVYNDVANPYFTSNYTVNNTVNGTDFLTSIESAGNVYLQFHNTYSTFNTGAGISLNYSKVSASSDFDFNISILSGSSSYDSAPFLSIAYFVNNTDTTNKDFSILHGYKVVFTSYENANLTATLRRCTSDLNAPGCGVNLASNSISLENYYAFDDPAYNFTVNNTLPIELNYNPATNLLTVYAGNHTLFTYTDTVYKSGGFAILAGYGSGFETTLKLDNLGISGTYASDTSGFQIYSFPLNQKDLIGFGTYTDLVSKSCPKSGTPIFNTPYQFSFGTIKLDEPCFDWFYAGFPDNGTIMSPFFLLKYNDVWVSHALLTQLNLSVVIGFQATQPDTCYISNKAKGQLDYAIPIDAWLPAVPIYIMSNRNGTYTQTNPYVFYGYDIYCVAPTNITFYLNTLTYTPNADSKLKMYNIPIGVYIDPITGQPNYSRPYNYTFAPSVFFPCTPGDLRTICQPPGTTSGGLISDFGGLSGLISPMVLLLGAVLAFGAIITKDTHSSQIGLIVIMAGCLILSFYNVLPWYITVLITIGAGFFLLSQVRTGVFGNAQPA